MESSKTIRFVAIAVVMAPVTFVTLVALVGLAALVAPATASVKQQARPRAVSSVHVRMGRSSPRKDVVPDVGRVTPPVTTQPPTGWSYQHTVGTLPQGSTAAQLLALLAFLLLIVGLLIHWSGDESCKEERSVYSSSAGEKPPRLHG